jgi:hypothetical protein
LVIDETGFLVGDDLDADEGPPVEEGVVGDVTSSESPLLKKGKKLVRKSDEGKRKICNLSLNSSNKIIDQTHTHTYTHAQKRTLTFSLILENHRFLSFYHQRRHRERMAFWEQFWRSIVT